MTASKISDRARVSSATYILVLLVCFMRGPSVSSATVLVSGPKDSPTVDPWIQQQELTAADGAPGDVFAYSVAVSGITAVIGAAGKTIGNNSGQGAAYVFTCSGTPCTWTQRQELTASDGARGDEFGNTVAVGGNTAIIGAPYKNSYRGAAYVFTCSGNPCTWRQQQELTASDGGLNDVFGYSVAVSGNTAIIGAIGKNSPRGAAYVFRCSGTPCTWTQQQELTASDGASGDVFGTRVAVSGTTAVIGAPGKTIGDNSLQGAAYVFTCSGIPCTWTQQQELIASDGVSRDEFGNRVAVSGNTVIIGNNSKQGAAYVFTCSGTPCTWKEQELTASDGGRGDEFGYSVAVSGNTAVIGAAYKSSYEGAAYVFSPAAAITGPPMRPPAPTRPPPP